MAVGVLVQILILEEAPNLQDPIGPLGLAVIGLAGGLTIIYTRGKSDRAVWLPIAGFFVVTSVLLGEHGSHGIWLISSLVIIVLASVRGKSTLLLLGVFLLIGSFWIHNVLWSLNPEAHYLYSDAGFLLLLTSGLAANALYLYRSGGRIVRVSQLFTREAAPVVDASVSAPQEAAPGQQIPLQLDIVNSGRELLRLTKIIEPAPRNFLLLGIPPSSHVEADGSVSFQDLALPPLKVSTLRFRAQPIEVGVFDLAPRLVVTDPSGRPIVISARPARLTARSPITFEFRRESARKIFYQLVKAYIEDYHVAHLNPDIAGWRSLARTASSAAVGKSHVYGSRGGFGPAIAEPLERGLVEIRSFDGERGRGGTVLKTRIRYDNDVVRRYVEELMLHGRPKEPPAGEQGLSK